MDEISERAWSCLWRARAGFGIAGNELPLDLRLRALGELVVVLTMAIDSGQAARPVVTALAEFAAAELERLDWAALARRDPRFYVAILTWHAFAVANRDARASAWHAIACRGWHSGALDALTPAPHRLLELWFLLRRAGLALADVAVEQLYDETIAGRRVPLPLYAPADAYALAHIVFYLSDHGRARPATFVSGAAAGALSALVRRALALALAEAQLDLCAELVIGAAFLDLTLPRVERILRPALDPAGWIVAPQAGQPATFARCYHATLVWALAASLLAGKPQ